MLVAQSLVLTAPVSEAVVAKIPDTTPYPRGVWFRNLSGTNTLTIKVQSSDDGGTTWEEVGASPYTLLPNGVVGVWVQVAGPFLRIVAAGNAQFYMGLSRFYVPGDVNLPLVSL